MKNKPVRILHILHRLDMGGAENFLMNIFRNVDRENWIFDFLVHGEGAFDEEVRTMGGKVFYLDGYINKVGVIKYRKMLREFFVSVGKQYKIIHSHVDQTSGFILPIIKKTIDAVCIVHSHNLCNYNNAVVKLYKKWLQYRLNQYADYRLACSKDAGKWLYGSRSFIIIANGIDVDKYRFKAEERISIRTTLGIKPDDFVIGHVGRFESVKNHIFLIKIFDEYRKKTKKVKLLLIGNGSLKNEVRKQVHEHEMDTSVMILDARKDINRYYNAMDLFILPSYFEGFGMAVIEAQANGLFVIASDGVSREARISERIEFLLLDEKERWIRKIAEVREKKYSREVKISKEYDIKNSINKLINLYDTIISQ